jgi:hypothetical protein
MNFFHFSSAFAVIALRAGSDYIRPLVRAAHVSRYYMIDCHTAITLPAVLTGIMVTAKDFPAR